MRISPFSLTSQVPAMPDVPEITVAELLRRLAAEPVQIVDVREAEEWAAGHVPGSVPMPMDQVTARLGELDPRRPAVTLCRSGRRSRFSARDLLEAGFPDVRSLAGGIIAWVEAGQALES